jgi:RNA polymerase sigma-70 factor (ECF subfamily)
MSRIDRAFRRYRAARDPRALAFVFDRTAPELLRLARYLAPDAAEDVLQETFVVAMERAETFDPQARVLPWLVGILVRKAKEARRRRTPADDASVPADATPGPEAAAAHAELRE